MLVQPWNYRDENVSYHDLSVEWRNGPYALLLLATQLRKHNHEVILVDLNRDLVAARGNLEACLSRFSQSVERFRPDIVGFGFYSVHYLEVKKAVQVARQAATRVGARPLFVAGGIHASVEPKGTIENLGFDYSFVGEADLGILELAEGKSPAAVLGVVGPDTSTWGKAKTVEDLDDLPFPEWSLCDYSFYAHPTWSRLKFRKSSSLDMMMGRGCMYKCSFCAYRRLSSIRYYSAEYLIDQIEYMRKTCRARGIYFLDSSIGNNWRRLREFCELAMRRGVAKKIEWYGNMRADQVSLKKLRLLWRAGCRYLFYGFESGSQRILDLMRKKTRVEDNYRVAEMHNALRFPYNASMILGYPSEREEDVLQTLQFLRKTKPPSVGINFYVPLPGSPDYDKMKSERLIDIEDPMEWRRIGEVNPSRVYADIPGGRFQELVDEANDAVSSGKPNSLRQALKWMPLHECLSASLRGIVSKVLRGLGLSSPKRRR
jgi:anaerobic magnesium-protoporphyrin IX monomethyl ester cyclase